jgi:hypothetical protein
VGCLRQRTARSRGPRWLQHRWKRSATRIDIALHDLFQAGFVDGNLAAVQQVDLGLVYIRAKHVVAEVGKAGTVDQAYIAVPITIRFIIFQAATAARWFCRKSAYAAPKPLFSSISGCQPSSISFELSISLRGLPSGLVRS